MHLVLEVESVGGIETSSKGLDMGEKLVGRDVDVEGVVVLQMAGPRVLNDGEDELLGSKICRVKYLEVGNFSLVFCLLFDADVGFSVLCNSFVVDIPFCCVYKAQAIFGGVLRCWHDETHKFVGAVFLVVGGGEEDFGEDLLQSREVSVKRLAADGLELLDVLREESRNFLQGNIFGWLPFRL